MKAQLGWPKDKKKIFDHLARKNTVAVVGVELGDEGKGRLVDNALETMLSKKKIDKVYVVRYQGGSNSGHTIEMNGKRFAVHQIPSSILHENTVGIVDRGMVIHAEDFLVEINTMESYVGSLKKKLFLSSDAVLCTDLERAEEYLNGIKTGKAKGGTKRGISPSYAHHYDRLGFHIYDLLSDDWKELFSLKYDQCEKEFSVYNVSLSDVDVIDLQKIKKQKKTATRKLGSRRIFLNRLARVRSEIIKRKLVTNTFLIHQEIAPDKRVGIIFEGAQALGLHPWLGTRPDVTSSDTSVYAVSSGTGFWRIQDIENRTGVFKITYSSSVGARRMPTYVENKWSNWVRDEAYEYGTTTGRPRDITYLDLPFLSYNLRMSGVETLSGTHLDIAKENENIKVCTKYTRNRKLISYQPGLRFQKNIKPHYIELPGWDGKKAQKAKSVKTLPKNAVKFLQFVQKATRFPIVAVTTGPARENFIQIKN